MAVASRHNKYVSIPDWFGGQSIETAPTVSESTTLPQHSSSSFGTTSIDFEDIPVDKQTIIWLNGLLAIPIDQNTIVLDLEKLTVPIDNEKIIIVDGKITTSTEVSGLWELRQTAAGNQYVYTALPIVTASGVTMFSDNSEIDIPTIAEGLPFDNKTIQYNKVTGQIEVIGGVDGGEADRVYWDNVYGKPQWLLDAGDNKPTYTYDEIIGLNKFIQDITDGFVTTDGTEQTIEGKKNFVKGLSINNLDIYNSQEDVIYIDANLVVRGGITMFALDEVEIPGVMDYIEPASYDKKGIASFDSEYFTVVGGHVTLIPDNVGLNETELEQYLTDNKYATQLWVTNQDYATSTELSTLTTKVNDFLYGSDTDDIINKWKELEAFLTGLDGSNDLATILSWKADKTYVDETFITIKGNEDVTGIHNFTNGLQIGGVPLYHTTDDIIYLEGNLVIKGGVTMYALDDVTVDSIIDKLPIASTTTKGIASFDSTFFIVDSNGKVSLIESNVGLNETELDAYLKYYEYATQDWVTDQGYLKTHQTIHSLTIKKNGTELGVYTPNNSAKEIDIIIPTKVSDLDNDSKFISGITSTMVTDALGYTPYNSTNFTKANIKSTLGISDWALATSKPSYKTSEVTEEINLYFTNARAVSALKSITDGLATDIATKWTQNNDKIANWDTAYGWGDHSKQDYTTNAYVNDTFVTLGTEQEVTGSKNFSGGIKVNGSPIYYDIDKKYWKLEGDLLVTGGVTMYGNDSDFVASTIMDAITVDGTTISKEGGVLRVIGDLSGGVTDFWALENIPSWIGLNKPSYTIGELSNVGSWADSVAPQDRIMYQAANSSTWVAKNLSDLAVGGVTGDYLPLTGGTLTGNLTVAQILNTSGNVLISQSSGTSTYVGNASVKTILFAASGLKADISGTRYDIWHSGNFNPNNYLPLSGGTLSGSERIVLSLKSSQEYGPVLELNDASDNLISNIGHIPSSKTSRYGAFWTNNESNIGIVLGSDGNAYIITDATNLEPKYPILHSGNYSSYALPLSGGVLTSSANKVLELNTTSQVEVGMRFSMSSVTKGWVGYIPSDGTNLYNNTSKAILGIKDDGTIHFNNNSVWHSGNDGSGSGLDADLLDGLDGSYFFSHKGTSNSFDTVLTNGSYRTTAFTPNNAYCYGLVAVFRSDSTCAQLYFPDWSEEPRYRMGWNAQSSMSAYSWVNLVTSNSIGSYNAGSATKLQTARTIWGQSFDGTGNVNGILTLNYNSSTSGIELTREGNYESSIAFNNGYGRSVIGSWGGGTHLWIQGLGNIITASMTNGNVGIGTTNPTQKLQVEGAALASVFYAQGGINGWNSDTSTVFTNRWAIYQWGRFLQITQRDANNNFLTAPINIDLYNGRVAILKNSIPNCALDVSGDILASGGITMYSDIRKKTKLRDVELSLKQIANAPLIEHYYNSDQNKTTHVGSIAQYWAGLNDWFCKLDNEGYYTMEIQNAALASAISIARELDKYESKTDKKIRQLKKRISQLEDELEILKNK